MEAPASASLSRTRDQTVATAAAGTSSRSSSCSTAIPARESELISFISGKPRSSSSILSVTRASTRSAVAPG